jgi:hypothetical protein
MALARHVWLSGLEQKPDGLFNRKSAPDAPENWFREDPAYAAELFALEVHPYYKPGQKIYIVAVEDENGIARRFEVTVRRVFETASRELSCAHLNKKDG